MRQPVRSALVLVPALCASAVLAQNPAPPAFEVASIKPSPEITPAMVASGKIHAGMRINAARVDIGQMSLLELIGRAFDVKPYQVDGPPWLKQLMKAPRFDIVAKMPAGATKEQVPKMLQALLAERFKLILHRETREDKVYALVTEKGGPKLKEAAPNPPVEPAADGSTPAKSGSGSSQMTVKTSANGAVMSDGKGGQFSMTPLPGGKGMRMEMSRMSMDELAQQAAGLEDRPVIDATGLKGNYQVALEISMQDMMNAARRAGVVVPAAGGDSNRPAETGDDPGEDSMRQSLRALGLKLEPRKMQIEHLIIDGIEKVPTEN